MIDAASGLPWPGILVNFLEGSLAAFGGGQGIFAVVAHSYVLPGLLATSSFSLAIALGQLTPGPISVAVVGMGFLLGGPLGALIALAAMLAPMCTFAVLVSQPATEAPTRRFVTRAEPVVRWLVPCLSGYVAYGLVASHLAISPTGLLSVGLAVITLLLGMRRRWEPSRAILVGIVLSVGAYALPYLG